MRKILCWLGFHKWGSRVVRVDILADYFAVYEKCCKCGEIKVLDLRSTK